MIVALISGLSVAVPSVIATLVSNKKSETLMVYRINQLEDKVNKHNNLIDRMYKAESDIAVLKDEMKGLGK